MRRVTVTFMRTICKRYLEKKLLETVTFTIDMSNVESGLNVGKIATEKNERYV